MKKLHYLFEAFLVHSFMALFRSLSPDTASDIGGWIGRHLGPHLPANRKTKRHIANSLHTSPAETARIATGMWENLGRLFAEYPHLPTLYMHRTELVGIEHLGHILTTPDAPAIFFSGHLANWEVAAPSLRQKNINIDLIYRSPNNPYIKDILDQCRSMDGTLMTYPKSAQGMRDVMSALKRGRKIGILIDQKYNQGVEVPFFGQPAMTSLAFIHLAKRFQCPLIPAKVERLNGAHFRATLFPPMDLSKDDMTLVNEANALLESWITPRPEHWLWLHQRWKKRT